LVYDANGNMTTGLGSRLMIYDGESRPLSATYAGQRSRLMSAARTAHG